MGTLHRQHPLKNLARLILRDELLQARKNYIALDRKYIEAVERNMTLAMALEKVIVHSQMALS